MNETAYSGGSQQTRKTPAKRMISQRKFVFVQSSGPRRASDIDFAGFPPVNGQAIEILVNGVPGRAQDAGGAHG
jgi:hypothetical protein